MFDAEKETNKIIEFIRKYYNDNNLGGCVIGISGGKDSAVVAALFTKALGSNNVIGLTLPCHSNERDIIDAKKISDYYGFKLYNIDLTNTFDTFKEEIYKIDNYKDDDLLNSDINLKPRLRMSSCYYMAALLSSINNKTYLVAGTSNKSELFVGYFTKGGDSVHDIAVLSDLTTEEVIKIGEYLNVPNEILYKTPSDGLSNLSDEDKLGVTYKEINNYINNKECVNKDKIIKLHNSSRHKFNIPTYYKTKHIGVYVGSFDPVHKGHKRVMDYLLDKLDKIIVIPTNDYWDKKLNVSLEHRLNMLMFYSSDRVIIDNKLNNYKYTYEILNKLKEEYTNDELYLIIGDDNIIDFDKWMNIDDILLNNVIVINRNNIDVSKYITKFNSNNFIICNDFNPTNISSTIIRKLIIENNYNVLTEYLDESIINYIKDNMLYK